MHRIDCVARLVATPTSRRALFAVVAALLPHRWVRADCVPGHPGCTCAETEPYCVAGYGCRGDGVCVVACDVSPCSAGYRCDSDQLCYGDLLTPCNSSDDCSVELGLVCRTCAPDSGCTGTACQEDDYCERAEDCDLANCYGCVASSCMFECGDEEYCDGAGVCQPVIICSEAGADCAADGDCCEGLVCEGVCVPACTGDDLCSPGAICCDGHCVEHECCAGNPEHACGAGALCFEGACVPVCFHDLDCADGEICCEGVCAPIACCMADEAEKRRCPAGTICFEGYCDPFCESDKACAKGECCCPDGSCAGECCGGKKDEGVSFPDTGAGSVADGVTLAGVAAIAAAAAVLGAAIGRQDAAAG